MKVYKPRKELSGYVRYFWVLESVEPLSALTFPIGCPMMIFHRKSPLYIPELDTVQDSLTISGQVDFPSHLRTIGELEMIVAVFYPHTIGMFTGTTPYSFCNMEISGYDLDNRNIHEMGDKILECDNTDKCIEILENWLLSKIEPNVNLKKVGFSLWKMMTNTSKSINELADAACLGKKQYERVFREYVGMNPKRYYRIVRFQKSLLLMGKGERNCADVAYSCGYSDQSHFIREFKTMTGVTPKSFLLHNEACSELFEIPS